MQLTYTYTLVFYSNIRIHYIGLYLEIKLLNNRCIVVEMNAWLYNNCNTTKYFLYNNINNTSLEINHKKYIEFTYSWKHFKD